MFGSIRGVAIGVIMIVAGIVLLAGGETSDGALALGLGAALLILHMPLIQIGRFNLTLFARAIVFGGMAIYAGMEIMNGQIDLTMRHGRVSIPYGNYPFALAMMGISGFSLLNSLGFIKRD